MKKSFHFHLFSLLKLNLNKTLLLIIKTRKNIKLNCRKFRRIRNTQRTCYMPHQIVKDEKRNRNFGGIFSGNFLNGIATTSISILGDRSEGMFSRLLKTNFLNKSVALDQNQLETLNNQNLNSNLSDQSSHSRPVAAKTRPDFPPAGLTAAALNINLSSLAPLCASSSGNHSKDTNSSARVSRAASPAFGNSSENNRLRKT